MIAILLQFFPNSLLIFDPLKAYLLLLEDSGGMMLLSHRSQIDDLYLLLIGDWCH
jgi:hypothetical protein